MNTPATTRRLVTAVLVGVFLGYFEAALVVYLRELYYPDGFAFPLVIISEQLLVIEIAREAASLLLIGAIAVLAGRRFSERLGYFLILFGVWDIFYYIWLKVTINWPTSLLDWDILFLIPLPWIGPVLAPLLIAGLMVVFGARVVVLSERRHRFQSPVLTTILFLVGTGVILYSFMHDTAATLHQQLPQDYRYGLMVAGLLLYLAAFRLACFGQPPES